MTVTQMDQVKGIKMVVKMAYKLEKLRVVMIPMERKKVKQLANLLARS